MDRTAFLAKVKQARESEVQAIESAGGVNAWLMAGYQQQTGQTVFRTFKQWREQGYCVNKGESSFPLFSRPIAAIKAEQGKQSTEGEEKLFGVCHLFHLGQVSQKQKKQAV